MYRVGIDLGGTNIAVGVINSELKIIGRANIKTNAPRSADEIFDDAAKAVLMSLEDAKLTLNDITSVGIGVPGAVDHQSGLIDFSSNLKFKNMSAKEMLSKRIQKPVFVNNDANCAALAEFKIGCGKGTSDFIVITLGTGVGSGIIINGKLINGINGAAGEIGHMVIDIDGIECACGRNGCYEKYASVTALINQTKEALLNDTDKNSLMWDMIDNIDNISGRTAFDAKRKGDELACIIIERYIYYLACGIINIVNLYQPDVIAIGGGISNEGDNIILPLLKHVEKERYSIYASKQTKICKAVLGNDAGIIGAALLNEFN